MPAATTAYTTLSRSNTAVGRAVRRTARRTMASVRPSAAASASSARPDGDHAVVGAELVAEVGGAAQDGRFVDVLVGQERLEHAPGDAGLGLGRRPVTQELEPDGRHRGVDDAEVGGVEIVAVGDDEDEGGVLGPERHRDDAHRPPGAGDRDHSDVGFAARRAAPRARRRPCRGPSRARRPGRGDRVQGREVAVDDHERGSADGSRGLDDVGQPRALQHAGRDGALEPQRPLQRLGALGQEAVQLAEPLDRPLAVGVQAGVGDGHGGGAGERCHERDVVGRRLVDGPMGRHQHAEELVLHEHRRAHDGADALGPVVDRLLVLAHVAHAHDAAGSGWRRPGSSSSTLHVAS